MIEDKSAESTVDLVGHVLHEQTRLARSRRRLLWVLFGVLLAVIGGLVYQNQSQRDAGRAKDITIKADASTIKNQLSTISQLQIKSNEQTTAEVQLRNDVNTLSGDEALICSVYQLSPKLEALPSYAKYCLAKPTVP